MNEYFADFHIHIGRTYKGQAVKITASKTLTFSHIMKEASERKGLDMIGIIDMHSPQVLEEVDELIAAGRVRELADGGLQYKNTVIMMGSEVELRFEPLQCSAHFLVYVPTLNRMKEFSSWLATKVKNVHLSTQRMYATMPELQDKVKNWNGLIIPAHIFTPFKSVYGNCTHSMKNIMDTRLIPAVELGLSSDSDMADCLNELHEKTFVTNSDAHSLPKIGREYQKLRMNRCSFTEWEDALWRRNGRGITANYGLHPKLGKYHLTRCAACEELVREEAAERCPCCGHSTFIRGVFNRIQDIADSSHPIHPPHRPSYIHQVPLEFIPKLGPKKMKELLQHFRTEMNILHHVSEQELTSVAGEMIASLIMKNRQGVMQLQEGGGGRYGKVIN